MTASETLRLVTAYVASTASPHATISFDDIYRRMERLAKNCPDEFGYKVEYARNWANGRHGPLNQESERYLYAAFKADSATSLFQCMPDARYIQSSNPEQFAQAVEQARAWANNLQP